MKACVDEGGRVIEPMKHAATELELGSVVEELLWVHPQAERAGHERSMKIELESGVVDVAGRVPEARTEPRTRLRELGREARLSKKRKRRFPVTGSHEHIRIPEGPP